MVSRLIEFRHRDGFRLRFANAAPNHFGNRQPFGGVVGAHVHGDEGGHLGRMIFADEPSTKMTRRPRWKITLPTLHSYLLRSA